VSTIESDVRYWHKADIVCRASATDTKKQLIGSLQQNGDAARLELVWQLVEMNDVDWDARRPRRRFGASATNSA
jgi:hypothetical protein